MGQSLTRLIFFFNFKSQIKKNTLCLGFKTGATLWYVLMNRLSYGTRPVLTCLLHNQKLYSGYIRKLSIKLGSRCSTVGSVVASNIRYPKFESSHQQLLLSIFLLLTICRKDENKEKEAGNGPFFVKNYLLN